MDGGDDRVAATARRCTSTSCGPEALPETAKVPVILSVGPYFNHSGQVGRDRARAGRADSTRSARPRAVGALRRLHRGRQADGARLRVRDGRPAQLRRLGAAAWTGWARASRATSRRPIEWAASQPWSTGRVGMYGKSYDAVTGMAGAIQNVPGLEAVVAQEPVYDMYRYLFSDGVRFANSAGTPALYDAIAVTPGPLLDDPLYNLNGLTTPDCLATNYADQQDPDHDVGLLEGARPDQAVPGCRSSSPRASSRTTPSPTAPSTSSTAVEGPEARVVRHVGPRPRQRQGRRGPPADGPQGLLRRDDALLRPLRARRAAGGRGDRQGPAGRRPDLRRHLALRAGVAARRRQACSGPSCRPGSYADDGNQAGTGSGAGGGLWTVSPPLPHDAWYAGVPRVTLQAPVTGTRSEIVVATYDIAPDRDGDAALAQRVARSPPTARSPSTSTATTGSCRPGTASASWSTARTPSGGCTRPRQRRSPSSRARSRLPFLSAQAAGHARRHTRGAARGVARGRAVRAAARTTITEAESRCVRPARRPDRRARRHADPRPDDAGAASGCASASPARRSG